MDFKWEKYSDVKPKRPGYYLIEYMDEDGHEFHSVNRFDYSNEKKTVYSKEFKREVTFDEKTPRLQFECEIWGCVYFWAEIPKTP